MRAFQNPLIRDPVEHYKLRLKIISLSETVAPKSAQKRCTNRFTTSDRRLYVVCPLGTARKRRSTPNICAMQYLVRSWCGY